MDNCDIVRDLLPLYADGLTSGKTNDFIRRHTESCAECRALMERMCTPLGENDKAENADYKKALKEQKHKAARKTLVFAAAALLAGIAACLLFLQGSGHFSMLDRQTSPDGRITATAYDGDSGTFFLKKGIFTVMTSGVFNSTTTYGSASFDGMWWSPDSRYLVVSMTSDDCERLVMDDFVSSSEENLNAYLSMGISGNEAFARARTDENGWPDIKYRFLQWSEYGSTMLIHYSFLDTAGIDRSGYFWFDCDAGSISGVMEQPVETAAGVIKEAGTHVDGTAFYVMDLQEPDENGNTVEFVFSITSSTAIRGFDEIQIGDSVMVVYQKDENIYDYPAISITNITEID